MKIRKAVITAAGRSQRAIPLQTIVAQDGTPKSVLAILGDEVAKAGIGDICVVTSPGYDAQYAESVGSHDCRFQFVAQAEPLGYGHAIECARGFTAGEAFLHLVGDHIYVSANGHDGTKALVSLAESEACSVSAVQATRESLLPYFGTVGGRRITGSPGVYRVETVIEKPTPTEAEQKLLVPGLRAGHYLCFFGMHVLTPSVFDLLDDLVARNVRELGQIQLTTALNLLAGKERYLALETRGSRFNLGVRFGVVEAQIALALAGADRERMLTLLLESIIRLEQLKT